MRLTFLGSSHGLPEANRKCSCILVEIGENRYLMDMGTDITTTAVLGDQLLTDALAGKLLGMTVIIVPPIADKKTLFFRFKRWIEKPYMNEYRRRHMFL